MKKKVKTNKWGTENAAPDSMRSPSEKGVNKFKEGTKEHAFVKQLDELKPRVEAINARNKEGCKDIDTKLAAMKTEIQ